MSYRSGHRPLDQAETEDDSRRVRVSQACSRCRTRKDRCDGLKPTCTACRNAESPCTYEAITKKRGLPEGYVRGLEKLLAIATSSIDGLEEALCHCIQDEVIKRSWNSVTAEEVHSLHWKDSRLRLELESLLNNTAAGSKRKRDQVDIPQDISSMLQDVKEASYCVVRGGLHAQSNGLFEGHEARTTIDEPFPTNSQRLFDLYFTHVHCWFPVLSRPTVLKSYYEFSRRPPSVRISATEGASRALLWAILAYATMVDLDETEARQRSSQFFQSNSLQCLLLKPEQIENEEQYVPMRSSNGFASELEGLSVVHAQALLILALLEQGRDHWLKAWIIGSAAKRILLVHDKQQSNSMIKGALQGSFVVETFLNLHWQFNTESPVQPELMDEDGYEEWESWSNGPSFALSVFNRLSQVLYAATDRSASTQECLQDVIELQQGNATAGVPPVTPGGSAPHHVYLQLAFSFAQLTLSSDLTTRRNAAARIFELLEVCRSPNIGLARVPPLYSDVIRIANKELSLYPDSTTNTTTLCAELAQSWPVFEFEKGTQPTTVGAPINVHSSRELMTSGLASFHPQLRPARENEAQGSSVLISTAPPGTTVQQLGIFHSPTYSHVLSNARNDNFNQIDSWAPFQGLARDVGQGTSTSYPATSPSFQADEIDAIFHDLAYLDTNEWTNERALGLREFGFDDDSAFMEFCNDPERLALTAASSSLPLSSDRQSWTFAAQPP